MSTQVVVDMFMPVSNEGVFDEMGIFQFVTDC